MVGILRPVSIFFVHPQVRSSPSPTGRTMSQASCLGFYPSRTVPAWDDQMNGAGMTTTVMLQELNTNISVNLVSKLFLWSAVGVRLEVRSQEHYWNVYDKQRSAQTFYLRHIISNLPLQYGLIKIQDTECLLVEKIVPLCDVSAASGPCSQRSTFNQSEIVLCTGKFAEWPLDMYHSVGHVSPCIVSDCYCLVCLGLSQPVRKPRAGWLLCRLNCPFKFSLMDLAQNEWTHFEGS